MSSQDGGRNRTFSYRKTLAGGDRPLPTTREWLPRYGCSTGPDLELHAFAAFQDVPVNSLGQPLGTWDRTGRRGG
jgi:hypothetical protein